MKNYEKLLENYAELILKRGVELEKSQILVIEETSVTAIEFLRILSKKAYEMGAKDVIIHFSDQELTKIRLENAELETLSKVPDWWIRSRTGYVDKNTCFLRLNNDLPDGLSGVDPEKLAAWKTATTVPLKELSFIKKDNRVKWSAAAAAGVKWAQKVFPDKGETEALEALWDSIFKACYVTEESGTEGWDRHICEMRKQVERINALKLRSLHFKNGLGTDLNIELCDDTIFAGGVCHCPEPDGKPFAPNIPTEEILSTPHKDKVNGIVYNSMPFIYAGNIVSGMKLKFIDGRVTEYSAKIGEDVLEGILRTDNGSSRLGEVALVPYNSPINQMGILFYNTLFDENASCHLALGAGYTDMILGEDRRIEVLEKKGLNNSALHVDFMFGTKDLCCIGTCVNGEKVSIFEKGGFSV